MLGVGQGLLPHPHLRSPLPPPGTEEMSSPGKICLFQNKEIYSHFTLLFREHFSACVFSSLSPFPGHDVHRAFWEQSPRGETGAGSGGSPVCTGVCICESPRVARQAVAWVTSGHLLPQEHPCRPHHLGDRDTTHGENRTSRGRQPCALLLVPWGGVSASGPQLLAARERCSNPPRTSGPGGYRARPAVAHRAR